MNELDELVSTAYTQGQKEFLEDEELIVLTREEAETLSNDLDDLANFALRVEQGYPALADYTWRLIVDEVCE